MTDPPRIDLAAALGREWQYLASRPDHVARARGWRLTSVAFDDLHQLLGHTGFDCADTRTHPVRANAVLREVVDVARHDQLAGRLVLQRILPCLLAACRRWRRGCAAAGVAPDELLGELVAVAWSAIASYSTARRPRNVAHNLVSDAVYRAFVAPTRRLRASEQPHDAHDFATVVADSRPSSVDEVADVLRDARGSGLDRRHVDLLCQLLRADGSAEQVAIQRGVSGRTIRTQRARATARVRAVTLASAA